jgi:hypothetical protein
MQALLWHWPEYYEPEKKKEPEESEELKESTPKNQ